MSTLADLSVNPQSDQPGSVLGAWADFNERWLKPKMAALRDSPTHKRLTSTDAKDRAQTHEVIRWIELLHAEDARCALAVVQRLEYVLSLVDSDGLSRWILSGLRCYPLEPKRLVNYFRLEDPRSIEALHAEATTDNLEQSLPSLTILLKGLSGFDITLQPRAQSVLNAPALRPVLTRSHLLLPDSYTHLDGSDRYRIYRAAAAHAAAHLLYSVPARLSNTLKPMGIAVVSAIEDARVEGLLVQDLPGVQRWFSEFLGRDVDPLKLDFVSLIARMSRVLHDDRCTDDNFWVNKARELFQAEVNRSGLQDYAAFRRIASILANDLGQMRVRFNPQQYAVPSVYRDDHSFLWDYGEPQVPPSEMQELHQTSVRLETEIVKAHPQDQDAVEPLSSAENQVSKYLYDEWDYRLEIRRPDWCTITDQVVEYKGRSPYSEASHAAAQPTLLPLVRTRRLSRSRRMRRQWEGEEIDLNAAIDIQVERRMDLAPDGRLFMRSGQQDRVSSVLILLDLSESANDRVGGCMQSILDMEKQSALMLARSTVRVSDRLAIHGFSSNTRAGVNYFRLLNFGEPLNARAEQAIQSVQAEYSTRLGAALRHAASFFADEPSDQHAIVVITDGAPSDVDVFDSKYLIEDARSAVLEARKNAINCFGMVLDARADAYVKRIFGWLNYRIVDNPKTLPHHLSRLYSRLTSI